MRAAGAILHTTADIPRAIHGAARMATQLIAVIEREMPQPPPVGSVAVVVRPRSDAL
jgi:hypothetical protein